MLLETVTVSRRALGVGVAAVSVAAVGLVAGCEATASTAGVGAPQPVTYLTSFGELGRDAYAEVARAKGFFAEAGIEVTIEPGAGTNPNLQALLGGQAQFAALDITGAIMARGEGVDGFLTLAAVQQLPLAALMTVDPSISHPLDLQGRKVGLPAGAITELLFETWAEVAGIDLDQVNQVPLGAPELTGALAAGQVDAIGQFLVGRPLIEAATGRPVTVFPYSDHLLDLFGIGLQTTVELAESDPDLCGRFRDALLRGLAYAVDHPEEAGRILQAANPAADAEVAAEELRLMRPYVMPLTPGEPIGAIDVDRLARSVALLQSAGAIQEWIAPEELLATELLPSRDS